MPFSNILTIKKVLEIIADADADVGARLTYIKILGEVNILESVPVLLRLMESGRSSGAIKQAALDALSRYDDPEIGSRVTKAYPDRLRADPFVRNAALSLLAQRKTWATQLLIAIDREKQPGEEFIAHTISKTDVTEPIARRLILLNDPLITETVNKLWPQVGPASSAEKNQRIEIVANILKSGSGNELRGRGLFKSRCESCHRLFDEGGTLGPDLTGYDRKNIGELLVNIIDPNTFIREGYETYRIVMDDRRTLLGNLKGQSGATLTLQPFTGEAIHCQQENVKEIEARKISLMPEGLMNGLTDQQIRDLMAYLTKDQSN
jgi:putative heme-binding domain-containing protein